ncbi:MAG: glycoside hydrolase family 2 TIM barrel-domain containing protein [Spirochaetia bacterium]
MRIEVFRGEERRCSYERITGFRRVEVCGTEIHLNGRAVALRGVCRHDISLEHGRAPTPDEVTEDLTAFRRLNINLIRTSHYPPSRHMLEECDRLGLLVEAEAPICWCYGFGPDRRSPTGESQTWQELSDRRQAEEHAAVVELTRETVAFCRNHPCVILWSLANESLWEKPFEPAARAVRELDSTRPLTFNWAQYRDDDREFCEVGVDHYPGPGGIARHANGNRPVLFDEYCHVNCYNRDELAGDPGLREYWGRPFSRMWEAMYRSPVIAGGSIWSGIDDFTRVPGQTGEFGYHDGQRVVGYGHWGLIDAARGEKPEAHHVYNVYAPVRIHSIEIIESDPFVLSPISPGSPAECSIAVTLENRMTFTPASRLSFYVSCTDNPESGADGILPDTLARVSGGEVACGDRGTIVLRVPLARAQERVHAVHLAVCDLRGVRVAVSSVVMETPANKVRIESRRLDHARAAGAIASWRMSDEADETSSFVLRSLFLSRLSLAQEGVKFEDRTITRREPVPLEWNARLSSSLSGGSVRLEGDVPGTGAGHITLEQLQPGFVAIRADLTVSRAQQCTEIGFLFDLPWYEAIVRWTRNAPWSWYPVGHIGRARGEELVHANAMFATRFDLDRITVYPAPWKDAEAGGHDAGGATRESGLTLVPAGYPLHLRAWVIDSGIRIAAMNVYTGGSERFLAAHQPPRSLEPGDTVTLAVGFGLVDGSAR